MVDGFGFTVKGPGVRTRQIAVLRPTNTNNRLHAAYQSPRVGLMTWWLRVRSPVEATFLSGVFSPLTSAEACGKSSRWLWKEK